MSRMQNRKGIIGTVLGTILLSVSVGMSGCAFGTAESYYKKAMRYYEDENYVEAVPGFEEAIVRNPERAEYYISYGLLKAEMGQYAEALELFDKAILEKDISMVRANNKKAYRAKGITYFNMFEYDKAMEEFERALSIEEASELNVDILVCMANICESRGDWRGAVSAYDEILRVEDGNAEIYTARAYAYLNIGGIQMSRNDYDKAIELDPDNINIYLGKYALMKKLNDEIGAAAVLSQAADLPVETDAERFQYAKIRYYQGEEDAAELLKASAEAGYTLSYFYLGEIAREAEEYQEALAYYETYLENHNTANSALYNQMAVCCLEIGEYGDALDYIADGLRISTKEQAKPLRHNEVAVYERMGEYERAYKKAGAYLEEYPDDERMQREYAFLESRLPKAE